MPGCLITNANLLNEIRVVAGSVDNEFTTSAACGNRNVDVSAEFGFANPWSSDMRFCSSINIG